MQHLINYEIDQLAQKLFLEYAYDPPEKLYALATALISYRHAWLCENPVKSLGEEEKSVRDQDGARKAMCDHDAFGDPISPDAFGERPKMRDIPSVTFKGSKILMDGGFTEEERSKIEAEIYKEEK